MTWNSAGRYGPALARSFAALFAVLCASAAGAQQAEPQLLAALPFADQRQPVVVAAPPVVAAVASPYWELTTGYEGDSKGAGSGYVGPGYVRPIRTGLSWTARAAASYITYHFDGVDGATRVRSPGVGAAIGLRFGDKNFFGINAGPELTWRRTQVTGLDAVTTSETDVTLGANVGGDMYLNPTSHNNIHGIVNYGTAERYTWSRLGFKEQLNNHSWEGPVTTFLGVEGIAQGNSDIRSTQVGGFFEFSHNPSKLSLAFRAGYKRSTFDVGLPETGPYFSIGFYQRLR